MSKNNWDYNSLDELFYFKVIIKGMGEGEVLFSKTPINFLAAVDKKDGTIQDAHHELYGNSIRDTILVFPYGVGSSVGAYTIYSLKSNNASPRAMICSKPDITTVSGCALANIPLVLVQENKTHDMIRGNQHYQKKDDKSTFAQANDLMVELVDFIERNSGKTLRVDTASEHGIVTLYE